VVSASNTSIGNTVQEHVPLDLGREHSLIVGDDGIVWAWGKNSYGQLGNGTTVNSTVLVPVSGLTDVIAVGTGMYFSVALKHDGTVWAWGHDYFGYSNNGEFVSKVPVQISGLTDVVSIAVADEHTLALKADGTVWAWGFNDMGQLGIGSKANVTTPTQVVGLTDVKKIATGEIASMALKQDGTVWAWGSPYLMGNGVQAESLIPSQVNISDVVDITMGRVAAVAVTQDGKVWVWGVNTHGQVGDSEGPLFNDNPVQVTNINDVVKVSAGYEHILALKQDGTLWAWGRNDHGQLGIGSLTKSEPPFQVAGISNVQEFATGPTQSAVITQDNVFWAWGADISYLYTGFYVFQATPTVLAGWLQSTGVPAPGPLSATNISHTSVSLSWEAPPGDVPTYEYDIYNGLNLVGSTNETHSTINNLFDSTTYSFSVKARDTAGNQSPFSNIVSVTTKAMDPTISLSITNRTDDSITLSWIPPTLAGSIYEIYMNDKLQTTLTETNGSYTITGLYRNSVYLFKIRQKMNGELHAVSSIVSASTDFIPPTIPTNLIVTNSTGTSLSLAWTASSDTVGVTQYNIYDGKSQIDTVSGTVTSYQLTEFRADTPYMLSVTAVDGAGNESAFSNTILAGSDLIAPSQPELSVTNRQANSIAISWTASTDNTGVASYKIYNNESLLEEVPGSKTRYVLSNLVANTTYNLSIRAVDLYNNISTASNIVAASTDVIAPTIPSSLTVTGITGTSVSLNWTASTDNIEVTGYNIYDQSTLIATSVGTTHTLTNLNADSIYKLTVRAKDLAGNLSATSNQVTVNTDVTAPTAPVLSVTGWTSSSISLSWSAAADNVGVAGYDLYKDGQFIIALSGYTRTYKVAGLDGNTTHAFHIKAKDAAGNLSEPSSVVKAYTDATPPTTPEALTVTGWTRASITLSWTAATDNIQVSGYDIYRFGTLVGTVSGSTTTYVVPGLSSNTSYSFTVRAKDAAGNVSGASNSVTASPDTTAPSTPNLLTVTGWTASSVSLAWSASTDNIAVTGYNIYNGTTLVGTVSGLTTNYTVSGLSGNTTYTFTVAATDAAGNKSVSSYPMSAYTDATAPTRPDSLAIVGRTASSISLTWTASSDNIRVVGYNIYHGTNLIATTSGTSHTLKGLSGNTMYHLTVTARDAAGNESTASNVVTASTDVSEPNAPVLSVTGWTGTSVSLSWTAATDNIAVTAYSIFEGDILVGNVSGETRSYTVTNLEANTSHTFHVKAKDAAGNVSVASNQVTAGTDAVAPSSPTDLIAKVKSESRIDLSWQGATDNIGVTGYNIYQDSTLIATVGRTKRNYEVKGLNVDTVYIFTVKAIDAAGNLSEASNTATGITDRTSPTPPSALTVTARTETSISLSWTASSDNIGVTGYNIYRETTVLGKTTTTLLATTTGSDNGYTLTEMDQNTIYTLKVRARDEAGNLSLDSNIVITGTDVVAPTAPSLLRLNQKDNTSIRLEWKSSIENSNAFYYDIYSGTTLIDTIWNFYGATTMYYRVSGIQSDTSYTFTVKARDGAGNVSDASNAVKITPSLEYVYDPAGRLSYARIIPFGHIVLEYEYDKNGNLLKKSKANNDNLLVDGSFERESLFWNLDNQMSISTDSAYEGTNSARFYSTTPVQSTTAGSTVAINVSPNTSYTLSALIKDNLTSGSFYVGWYEVEPDRASNYVKGRGQLVSTKRGQDEWEQVSIKITTGSYTKRIYIHVFADNNAIGEGFVDRIMVQ